MTDGCKKTAIVFDDAISTCEFVNCQSVQCQVRNLAKKSEQFIEMVTWFRNTFLIMLTSATHIDIIVVL